MFILVVLLSVLSLPRVWTKPTVAESELISTSKDDEKRFKRQAEFFDLLHQAIEKYANCTDEHLATLKALANYKQYQTFAYPGQAVQPFQTEEQAAKRNQNSPNLKCIKVNLCFLHNQPAQTATVHNKNIPTLEKPLNPQTKNAKQYIPIYFPSNKNDNRKTSATGSKDIRLKNLPAKFSSRYSQHNLGANNLTYVLSNQPIFNRFLHGLMANNRKQNNITGQDTFFGSALAGAHPSTQIKACSCLNIGAANQDNNNISATKDSNPTSSKLNKATTPQQINGCLCLEKAQQEFLASNKSETASLLGSAQTIDLPFSESEKWNQNLNQLLQQLDEMAHSANNEDLKHIVEQLKALKSAFETNSSDKACSSIDSTTTASISLTLSKNSTKSEVDQTTFPTEGFNQTAPNINVIHLPGSLNKSFESNKNDSKITISITSNGNFNKLQLEHQLAADKNFEVKEKDKFNVADPATRVSSLDMLGTSSRHINILKKPQKQDYYAEPILSEIYSGNSRFKTEPPLSVYLQKIKEKPLKLRKIPIDVWNTFQPFDIVDNKGSSEENISTIFRRGCANGDISDMERCESDELT